jgi:hypothetical protein
MSTLAVPAAASGKRTNFKPARAYEAFTRLSDGRSGFQMKTWGDPVVDGPGAITRAEVAKWLGDVSIPYTDDSLARLTDSLNMMRATVPASDALPDRYPLKSVQVALAALTDNMPAVMAELEDAVVNPLPHSQESQNQKRKDMLQELALFQSAVARVRRFIPDDIPPVNRKFQIWHDDALCLALHLLAMCNAAGKDIKFQNERSAAARFIATALDRATPIIQSGRKRPRTSDAVRRALSKHPQRGLIGIQ